MAKRIVSILEVALIIATIVIAIRWMRDPAGPYEPTLAACGGLSVGLELLRRYLRSLKLRVFLSVGATYTKLQEDYVLAFERVMADHDLERLVVGRDSPPVRQPILEVKHLMRRADAVVVLAFSRYTISSGVEKQGANIPEHKPRTIKDERHPTVWNQIEAGIAFGLGRPLFVVVEQGLKTEAMLKDRLEFLVRNSPLDPAYFQTPAFKKVFSEFLTIARRRSWSRL
jgi:hypothetical protein